jgi:8-amino-7-oxononanoate synthase
MTDWGDLREVLDGLAADGLLRVRREVEPTGPVTVRVDGRELVSFASNDYLGLAGSAELREAVRLAMEAIGPGAGASPLVSGRSPWQARAEEQLAALEGADAALLFPSGYAANLGTLAALLRPEDLVLCDRLNHACLVDGCRLSGAKLRVYRSDELETVRRELSRRSVGQRAWLVTDGVFSMDGELAPLAALCDLAEEFGARVIVDEAHGTGVFGATGRGVCEELGVEARVAVRIGTLSKALGAQGGFVAGPGVLVDYLVNTARTQMFSTALSPLLCAAASAAVGLVRSQPERRARVRELARTLRSGLRERGLAPLGREDCPIVPVLAAGPGEVVTWSGRLLEAGFLVPAIRPPTVPRGGSRLRISLSAGHEERQVAVLVEAVAETGRGLG